MNSNLKKIKTITEMSERKMGKQKLTTRTHIKNAPTIGVFNNWPLKQ